jgi:hypothetical protein
MSKNTPRAALRMIWFTGGLIGGATATIIVMM